MKEIYRVLSGALAEEQRLSQISNNLANVSTVGFKKDGAVFVDYLKQQMVEQAQAGLPVEPANPAMEGWASFNQSYVDHSTGPFQQTGHQLDFAIEGDGYFQVQV